MSRDPLDDIADAILDGTPIDWTAVDAGDDALVEQLKALAALRAVPRQDDAAARPKPWQWGPLHVFERIGQGSSGDVYRAWDPGLDREVALKLRAADAGDPLAAEEEGRLLARVEHPNVVTIHGAATIDGRMGLWMELLRGRTLEEAIRGGRGFTADEVARLGIDLCGAVSAVHAAGLLHRDIKAQNVMLDDRGRLVLMDFGTGRKVDDATGPPSAGTPLYLAPEVLAGGDATPQSDVYGIGVVLYRLATGSYPVYGADLADLRRAHRLGGATRIGLAHAHVPARLRRVIARAIDPDPARRYADTAALGAALAAAARAPIVSRMALVSAAALVVAAVAIASLNPGWRASLLPMAAPVAATTPAIVVLPFQNVGSDPGSEAFVDGLTIEVIRNLAAIEGLQVRSQTSSFYFKDQPRDLRDVASRLDVGLVLEARVQRSGDLLRITAQLVRAPDDVRLWSDRFEGRLEDVFAFQDEISRAIVNRLRLRFARERRPYQTSIGAYDLYLRGRVLVERGGTDDSREAARLFEQVIALDREYAPAHAGLAEAYSGMSWQQSSGLTPAEGLAGMRPAALAALALDPALPEAHAAMGLVHVRELDWDLSRQAFERALALPGALSEIRATYAMATLLPMGEAAEAERMFTAALTADPLSLPLRRDLGTAQLLGGRYEAAVENLQRVVDADPTVFAVGNLLARALTFAGRPEEAIALWESRRWNDWERWLLPAYIAVGRHGDVDRIIGIDINRHDLPLRQANAHAARGDKTRTFEALNRAVDLFPDRTAFTIAGPEMALLRGDPRLDELRRRLNLQ